MLDSSYPTPPGADGAARLLGLDEGMDLRQRGSLVELNRALHRLWGLGRNFVLGWSPAGNDLLLLVVPHYGIADYALLHEAELEAGHDFLARLLSGSRRYTASQLERAARLLGSEPIRLPLRQPLTGDETEIRIVDDLVRRYGVSYSASRAVALFDIVGFSLLSPFEQMTQLNSLSYSLNAAHSKMLEGRMHIDFARSGTGDGFYVWNRKVDENADLHLYHFMHLVLADNAIARGKAHGRTVPLLRAGFHVGSCYEFYHAEGLNPTLFTDIVGQVTIELARIVENAMPGQILVAEFLTAPADSPPLHEPDTVDAVSFVDRAQHNLSQLNGLELSGDAIESIKCYLTGSARADGSFSIRKLAIYDKHGLTRNAFNAKVNIYRRAADPILLGIEDRLLRNKRFRAPELVDQATDH